VTEVDEHDTVPRRAPLDRAPASAPEPDGTDTVLRDPTKPTHPERDVEVEDEASEDTRPSEPVCFRISNGATELLLEEDVHIGRNPRPPRSVRGGPVRLVRVESPSGVISGSHLGLRRMGSTAVAADLMSTNGTVVVLPGFAPRRLRQGESLAAPPGTRLEIGEGIVIEVIKRRGLD
jgi:hypothetical protein